ncbi:MAG TPA: hypothetical protein VFJ14_11840 [Nocardioidaceae bacterium]|nr:hypothetical protein [Nocardioidaceae bacterium]
MSPLRSGAVGPARPARKLQLGSGVVFAGDITISLSSVDSAQVKLHALITSVSADVAEER